jgi:hypothetical protein
MLVKQGHSGSEQVRAAKINSSLFMVIALIASLALIALQHFGCSTSVLRLG